MPRQRSGVEPLADMREGVAAGAEELAGEREVGELERRKVRAAAAAGGTREPAARGTRAVGEHDAAGILAACEAERRPRAAHLQVALRCELDCRSDGHETSSLSTNLPNWDPSFLRTPGYSRYLADFGSKRKLGGSSSFG